MSDNMLGVALHEARGPLNTLIGRLSGQEGAVWLRRLNRFNRGENPFTSFEEFFKTREGLRVSDDFRSLVLSKAEVSASADARPFDLPRDMSDSEIERELGENHVYTEDEVCTIVQTLIEEQWGGKGGKLLNNGYANIFYTGSCVVLVLWFAGGREWDVSTWKRGDCRWDAGCRAFSRN